MSRDDYDDDPPAARRSRLREDDDRLPPAKGMSIWGLFSMIGGIVSLLVSFVPCVGAIAIVGGVLALLLGVIGLFVAGKYNHGRGMSVAGVIVSILSIGIATVWIVLMGGMGMAVQEAEKEEARQTEEVSTAKEVIRINAADLSREFERDAVNAEKKYSGKILEIRGMVGGVMTLVGKTRLTVDGSVDCDFSSAKKDELAGYEALETITVRGKCTGKRGSFNNVHLDHCTVVRLKRSPGAPAIKVTADELNQAYEDGNSGDEKYTGKTIRLTGKFVRQDAEKSGKTRIFLEAKTRNFIKEVSCTFDGSAKVSLQNLKAGDEVTVVGVCEGLVLLMVRVSDCELAK